MNAIVNKLLLAGEEFMPGLIYSACGTFTRNKERIETFKEFKETGDSRYIYQNELDKACFQHDLTY